MDFHPLRDIRNIPGLRVLEGIFTIKNLSFPHLVLATTSFLFQTQNAAPIFVFTSLPILIDLAANQPPAHFLLTSAGILAPSLTFGGLLTSWGLVPNVGQVLLGQTVLSAAIGLAIIMAVLAHRSLIRSGILGDGDWTTTLVFGLIWAAALLVISSISPFGRFEIPSPSAKDIPILAPVLKHFGETGADTLLGSAAYAIAHTGETLWNKRDPIQNGTLPTFRDDHTTPTAAEPGHGRRDRSFSDSLSSRQTTETSSSDSTLDGPATLTPSTMREHDTSTAPTSLSPSSRKRSPFNPSTVCLAGIAAALGAAHTLEPVIGTTSESLKTQTPFSLGFVLPPAKGPWRLSELVHEAQTIGNRANLLVLPESAYDADDPWDRQYAIDKFVRDVCQKYTVWVQLGIDTPMESLSGEDLLIQRGNITTLKTARGTKKVNEVILIGPEGYIGSYAKQSLIPYVESFPFHKGIVSIPIWKIDLPAPPGLNKTDWAALPPYTRPIHISPLICLDTFHPDLLSSLADQPPDLFTVSASALTTKIASRILSRAETIAMTHSAPVMVVAGSKGRMDQGISAILDGRGRALMQQRGGRSAVYQVALPYRKEGKKRGGDWRMGSRTVLGAGIILVAGGALTKRVRRSARTDNFPMKVFKYLEARVYRNRSGGAPEDPVTPPPRYRRSGYPRRSSEMRHGGQWRQSEESEWA